MANYFFDTCKPESLPEVIEIMEQTGLPMEENEQGIVWHMDDHKYTEEDTFFIALYRTEEGVRPFSIQTHPKKTHLNNPEVLNVLQLLIAACKPQKVYRLGPNEYDMSEFE